MIREIVFNNFSKARFWFDNIPQLFRIDNNKESVAVKSTQSKSILSKEILLELYIPFGAKIDYGILGIKTQGDRDKLIFELYKDNKNKESFHDSYSKLIDTIYIGLPDEYCNAIKDTITKLNETFTEIPTGKIEVCYGAHGIVNSSANIFKHLVLVLIKLAFSNKTEYSDEELKELCNPS